MIWVWMWPLVRRKVLCRCYCSRVILPEPWSDRSGKHDYIRCSQVFGNAVVQIFNGEAKVVVDCLLWQGPYGPVRRVDECGLFKQWVRFPYCFKEGLCVCDFCDNRGVIVTFEESLAWCVFEYDLGPIDGLRQYGVLII